jgi:hypothetical protein
MGCNFSGADTASHIASDHSIGSATWFWSCEPKTLAGSLNKYAKLYGAKNSKSIFLTTQCFVLGHFPGKLGDDLAVMRKNGKTYSESGGKIIVNGNRYTPPSNWIKRRDAFTKAVNYFN